MCFLGLHKWSGWGDVTKVNVTSGGYIWMQYRWCYKCRKADRRTV